MLGSYYGYLKFAEAAGFEPVKISECKEGWAEPFRGFLYNRVPFSDIEPDSISWYEYPGLETTTPLFYVPGEWDTVTYGIFLEGDKPMYSTETNSENERTAALEKDSYGNPFIPWLAPHYGKIIAVDPRTFTGSVADILAQNDNVDLIFVNYAMSTTYLDLVEGIEKIR